MKDWHRNWQDREHAVEFDGWSGMDPDNLVRMFEGFNDVRLLVEQLAGRTPGTLLEVGCATGEFSRYLQRRFPTWRYVGADISEVALHRAREKYPAVNFVQVQPGSSPTEAWRAAGLARAPEVVFAKDVIQHQPTPFDMLSALVEAAGQFMVARFRTRDKGASIVDPELSCQFIYADRVPYMVLNVDEVVARVRQVAPKAEVVIWRHHMVLGGKYGRFVPKELYLKETGTAESAIGVLLQTDHPGRITIEDRPNEQPNYTVGYALRHAARQAVQGFRACRQRETVSA
jgi:SAM-dependent methyltransferase